jgi:hypothetical protein
MHGEVRMSGASIVIIWGSRIAIFLFCNLCSDMAYKKELRNELANMENGEAVQTRHAGQPSERALGRARAQFYVSYCPFFGRAPYLIWAET